MTIEIRSNFWQDEPKKEPKPLPKEFEALLDLSNKTTQEVYPGSYMLPREQIWCLDRDEFKKYYESVPPLNTFTHRNLKAIGAENIFKSPYQPDQTYFHRDSIFPPEIYFVAQEFPVESAYTEKRAWAEYFLVKSFTEASIFHSRIRKSVPYSDDIKDILEKRLEIESRVLPKDFPTINKDALNKLLVGYKDIISFDDSPMIEIEGATIYYVTEVPSNHEGKQREVLFAAGRDLSGDIARFLATKAARAALYDLVGNYPEDLRKSVKKMYQSLLDREKISEERTRQFLLSIGLATHNDIFHAYFNSTIPLKFIEAKKKRKKLTYPV